MAEIIQRSEEWFEIRRGKVTASRIADLMARTKTGWGASRANYMAELVCERMTGQTQERYTNAAMLRGIEMEPDAIRAYEFYRSHDVKPVGFVQHPRIAMMGASPDGHIGAHGSTEIKCPNTATHIETLLAGTTIANQYVLQMQGQMACSGRKWCDFVSYDPRMPEELKLFVLRVKRDEVRIEEIEKAVEEFLVEVDAKVMQLIRLCQGSNSLIETLEQSLAMVGGSK